MEGKSELERKLEDTELITRAIQKAVADASEVHRKMGNPVAVWQNGKVVLVRLDKDGTSADSD